MREFKMIQLNLDDAGGWFRSYLLTTILSLISNNPGGLIEDC